VIGVPSVRRGEKRHIFPHQNNAGDSILREFIGGSILRDYEPWQH